MLMSFAFPQLLGYYFPRVVLEGEAAVHIPLEPRQPAAWGKAKRRGKRQSPGPTVQ